MTLVARNIYKNESNEIIDILQYDDKYQRTEYISFYSEKEILVKNRCLEFKSNFQRFGERKMPIM